MSILQSRLLECQNRSERALCALAILTEQLQPEQAFIYGLREGRAALLCSLDDQPEPEQLCAAVQRYVQRELQFEEATALVVPPVQSDEPISLDSAADSGLLLETQATTLASDAGRSLHPLLLASRREGQLTIAGVVALRFRAGRRSMPQPSLLEALADALIMHDDVDPVTCLA